MNNFRPVSVLPVFSQIYECYIDSGDIVLGILLDFSKAFDTVIIKF